MLSGCECVVCFCQPRVCPHAGTVAHFDFPQAAGWIACRGGKRRPAPRAGHWTTIAPPTRNYRSQVALAAANVAGKCPPPPNKVPKSPGHTCTQSLSLTSNNRISSEAQSFQRFQVSLEHRTINGAVSATKLRGGSKVTRIRKRARAAGLRRRHHCYYAVLYSKSPPHLIPCRPIYYSLPPNRETDFSTRPPPLSRHDFQPLRLFDTRYQSQTTPKNPHFHAQCYTLSSAVDATYRRVETRLTLDYPHDTQRSLPTPYTRNSYPYPPPWSSSKSSSGGFNSSGSSC